MVKSDDYLEQYPFFNRDRRIDLFRKALRQMYLDKYQKSLSCKCFLSASLIRDYEVFECSSHRHACIACGIEKLSFTLTWNVLSWVCVELHRTCFIIDRKSTAFRWIVINMAQPPYLRAERLGWFSCMTIVVSRYSHSFIGPVQHYKVYD